MNYLQCCLLYGLVAFAKGVAYLTESKDQTHLAKYNGSHPLLPRVT